MKIEDGVLTLHQSDISNYMKCPEQFRRANGILGGCETELVEGGRVESDAATVGTVLHHAIEQDIDAPFKTVVSLQAEARNYFGQLIQSYMETETEYRTESFGDALNALKELDWLVESWYTSKERDYWVHREPGSFLAETHFDVEFVTRASNNGISAVRLAGTPDIVDLQENRVLDWKSASRPYQRWEYQRWAVQPTAYTYAAASQGLIKPNADGNYQFDYRIFLKGKKLDTQEMTIMRGPGQWAWLTMVVNNIADMCESNAEHWPLRDDGWWCGPRWCPFWSDCKGAFVDAENDWR